MFSSSCLGYEIHHAMDVSGDISADRLQTVPSGLPLRISSQLSGPFRSRSGVSHKSLKLEKAVSAVLLEGVHGFDEILLVLDPFGGRLVRQLLGQLVPTGEFHYGTSGNPVQLVIKNIRILLHLWCELHVPSAVWGRKELLTVLVCTLCCLSHCLLESSCWRASLSSNKSCERGVTAFLSPRSSLRRNHIPQGIQANHPRELAGVPVVPGNDLHQGDRTKGPWFLSTRGNCLGCVHETFTALDSNCPGCRAKCSV